MKIHILVLFGLLAQAIAACAQVPSLFNYQGYLQDAFGNPATGSVNIAIALFTDASGGSAVYSESIGSVSLDKGIYSFQYGTDASAMATALTNASIWVELTINAAALSPRQRLMAVPYAARSGYSAMAGAVDGYDSTYAASEDIKQEMAQALLSQEIEAYLMTTGDRWDWPDYLAGESMSMTNGQWGTLVTNTAGSYLNFSGGATTQKLLIAGAYGNAFTSEVATSAVGWSVVKTINVDAAVGVVSNQYRNSWSDWARASCRIHFYYSNGTDAYSETLQNTQRNTNWVSASYANPQPNTPVDYLTVELFEEGGITVYERFTCIMLSAPAIATYNLTSFFQGAITQSMVLIRGRRQLGDSITYSLSDGTQQDSGLALGVANAAIQATGIPQSITFYLQPAAYANNPTYGGTALSSYVLRVWPAQ